MYRKEMPYIPIVSLNEWNRPFIGENFLIIEQKITNQSFSHEHLY